jgi:mannose-6-phosphate isomerase-like protein (cupin superfamily)
VFLSAIVSTVALLTASAQTPNRPVEAPRLFHYTQEQMREYERSLAPRMNQYKQAAEQLANFGNQTAWVAHREANGLVEIHQEWSDLMFIVSGAGSLRVGGDMDRPYAESPGELRSATGRGGETRPLKPGDVINVPAGVPHQFLVPAGQQITFFTMKIARPPT